MKNDILKLQNRVRNVPFAQGIYKTGIPFVTAYRFTTNEIQMPKTENPYLYIVIDGMLRLYTPSGIMDYMAGQYSISKIDTPLRGTVLAFSEQDDFLAISVEFTAHDVITVALGLDTDLIKKIMGEKLGEQTMSVARRLMLDQNKNVTEASAEVGYESLSQFIRDYRKVFGAAPKEDILAIQRRLKK